MAAGLTDQDTMFSVRQMPWHGLGAVLDEYPSGIKDALQKAGLGWEVEQADVFTPDPNPVKVTTVLFHRTKETPPPFIPAEGFIANRRTDTNAVLGIVGPDYKVVQNEEAFAWLDSLINSDLYFETAGSLWGGRKVWALARLPEYVEVGGDQTGTYIFVATSHDGSLAVTAAVSPIRIVCANTLSAALRGAARSYKFRHTGDLQAKYDEARTVLQITLDYEKQFKEVGDRLARERLSTPAFEERVLDFLFPVDEDTTKRARKMREASKGHILDLWNGVGPDGDTRGNSPGTKWTAYNAVAEYADFGRIYTPRTNQVQRSFEDHSLKQRALDLVLDA